MNDTQDADAVPALDGFRRRSGLMFRAGLAGGFGSFALYLAFGWLQGGETVEGSPLGTLLVIVSFLGALSALAGALLVPRTIIHTPPRSEDESSTESFLRLAERAEAWILRARRYLIIGGAFGGVVWVPLLLFGLFAGPQDGSAIYLRILSMAGSLAFVSVAVLWWRRILEIDRELRAWRTQHARLRQIEASILAEP